MSWRRGPRPNLARWNKIRLQVLDGDSWRCRRCGKQAAQVDHIVPLNRGGDLYDFGNLQSLCVKDHLDKTRGENQIKPTPLEVLEWQAYLVAQIANKG